MKDDIGWPDDPEYTEAWIAEAERRFEELRSGKVRGIPAEEVFAAIRKRPRPRLDGG